MNQRETDDLDNYITGHCGNDQFDDDEEEEFCGYFRKWFRYWKL